MLKLHFQWKNVPHACKKLDQATVAVRDGYDEIWLSDAPCADVDEGEDESCQRESREA
jgi:hypothetical protein